MTWNNGAMNYDEHLANMKHELDRYDKLIKNIDKILFESTGEHIDNLSNLKNKLSETILVDHEFIEKIKKPPGDPVEHVGFFLYNGYLYLLGYKERSEPFRDYNIIYRYDFTTLTWMNRRGLDFNETKNVIQHGEYLYLLDYGYIGKDWSRRIVKYNLESEKTTILGKNESEKTTILGKNESENHWRSGLSYNKKLYYFDVDRLSTGRDYENKYIYNISTFDIATETYNFKIAGKEPCIGNSRVKFLYAETDSKLFILGAENTLVIYDVITGTFESKNMSSIIKSKPEGRYYWGNKDFAVTMCAIKDDLLFFTNCNRDSINSIFYNYVTNEFYQGSQMLPITENQASFFYKNRIFIGGSEGSYARDNNELIAYYPKIKNN